MLTYLAILILLREQDFEGGGALADAEHLHAAVESWSMAGKEGAMRMFLSSGSMP